MPRSDAMIDRRTKNHSEQHRALAVNPIALVVAAGTDTLP